MGTRAAACAARRPGNRAGGGADVRSRYIHSRSTARRAVRVLAGRDRSCLGSNFLALLRERGRRGPGARAVRHRAGSRGGDRRRRPTGRGGPWRYSSTSPSCCVADPCEDEDRVDAEPDPSRTCPTRGSLAGDAAGAGGVEDLAGPAPWELAAANFVPAPVDRAPSSAGTCLAGGWRWCSARSATERGAAVLMPNEKRECVNRGLLSRRNDAMPNTPLRSREACRGMARRRGRARCCCLLS